MNRFIAIHDKYGIFITSINGAAFFSDNDPFGFTKCESFENEEEAKNFFEARMPDYVEEFSFIEVDSRTDKVDVVEIIKSGYDGKHTENMFLNLPAASEALH